MLSETRQEVGEEVEDAVCACYGLTEWPRIGVLSGWRSNEVIGITGQDHWATGPS